MRGSLSKINHERVIIGLLLTLTILLKQVHKGKVPRIPLIHIYKLHVVKPYSTYSLQLVDLHIKSHLCHNN